MGDRWSNMQYFGNSCSVPNDFTQLCRAFVHDLEHITPAYHRALRELNPPYSSAATTQMVRVSEFARDDRKLLEYCLALLFELYETGVNGKHAVGVLLAELDLVEWEHCSLLSTIPLPGGEETIFSTPFIERIRWAVNSSCEGLKSILDAFLALYFKWTLFRWICYFIAFVTCGALALLMIPQLLERVALSIVNTITTWSQEGLHLFRNIAGELDPGHEIGLPSVPIYEGIFEASKTTIYMSAIAANLSILPQLLQHSRTNILGAAAIVMGSQLEEGPQLAAEYAKIVDSMEELIDVSRGWNIRVDSLVAMFESLLNTTIARFDDINVPSKLADSIYVSSSTLCGVLCVDSILSTGTIYIHPSECLACGILISSTALTAMCLERPSSAPPIEYCARWLNIAPGVGGNLDEIAESRALAVRKLRSFLDLLDIDMRTLLAQASRGQELCRTADTSFQRISVLTVANENINNRKLQVMESQKWQPKAWLDWVGISYGLAEKRAGLRVCQANLEQTMYYHMFAYEQFTAAKSVLWYWKSDIEGVMSNLHRFEAMAEEGWRGVWKTWPDWENLKADFERLRPVVTALANANKRLAAKNGESEERFQRAGRECFEAANQARERGIAFNWDACFDAQKILA